MFFKRKTLIWIWDALYVCGNDEEYFPVYDQEFQTVEEMDKFIYEIMEEEGKPKPYRRLSAHAVGHRYERK